MHSLFESHKKSANLFHYRNMVSLYWQDLKKYCVDTTFKSHVANQQAMRSILNLRFNKQEIGAMLNNSNTPQTNSNSSWQWLHLNQNVPSDYSEGAIENKQALIPLCLWRIVGHKSLHQPMHFIFFFLWCIQTSSSTSRSRQQKRDSEKKHPGLVLTKNKHTNNSNINNNHKNSWQLRPQMQYRIFCLNRTLSYSYSYLPSVPFMHGFCLQAAGQIMAKCCTNIVIPHAITDQTESQAIACDIVKM